MLGNGSKDVNGELVHIGHIDGLKLDAALHQVRNEVSYNGKKVSNTNYAHVLRTHSRIDFSRSTT